MARKDPQKNREYQAKWYKKNQQLQKERTAKIKKEKSLWLAEYKKNICCSSCGENHPACMEFHHIDKTKKSFGLATAANRNYSLERIKEEIQKCKILCSNCHRKLHWEERLQDFPLNSL